MINNSRKRKVIVSTETQYRMYWTKFCKAGFEICFSDLSFLCESVIGARVVQ